MASELPVCARRAATSGAAIATTAADTLRYGANKGAAAVLCALLLLTWLAAAQASSAATRVFGDPYFETVATIDAIPDLNVTVAVEDALGFLWIGTPNGLFRYDGHHFVHFGAGNATERSLGGVFVRSLLVARDGRLWVGTDAHGLAMLQPATGQFTRYRHDPAESSSLVHDTVMALAEDRDGHLWVGTRNGLDRLDIQAGHFEHQRGGPFDSGKGEDRRVLALLVDPAGDLWIGTWNGLNLRRAANGAIERWHSAAGDALAGHQVGSLNLLADGRIGVATTHRGAFLIGNDRTSLRAIELPVNGEWSWADPEVGGLLQPRPDEIWIAGYRGIVVIDAATLGVRQYLRRDVSIASSLSVSHVETMLKDRSGNLWLGGFGGGLQRHDPANQSVRVVHHSPTRAGGLSNPSVGGVLELSNNEIWIGTRGNGVDILDRQRGVVAAVRASATGGVLSSGIVSSLAQTADGSVWVGTVAGLNRVDAASHARMEVEVPAALTEANVRRLLPGQQGDLWIGSNIGLAHWSPQDQRIALLSAGGDDVLAGDINAIVQDADSRLWVGCGAGGLYTLAPGQLELRKVATRVSGKETVVSVVGMLRDRGGTLWIDSSEGLYRVIGHDQDGVHLEDVSSVLGVGGQPFGANLLEDAQGRLWTQRFVLDAARSSAYELTRGDGVDIGVPWFRAFARTRDGLLMFGGSEGLLVIDPDAFAPRSYAAPLRITELRVDGTEVPVGWPAHTLDIAPSVRSIAVEFAGLDYADGRRSSYQYRLDGYDTEWLTVDADHRLASYGKLSPGDYVLRVRGHSRSGVAMGNEISLPISVQAAYWQTPWFKLVLLLLALLIVHGGYQLRVRRMRAHARHLEQMVDQRTAELEHAKQHAETALVDLKEAQQQLVAAEKMASLGALVAGVAHEINTPLGVAVTATSHLHGELQSVESAIADRSLVWSHVQQFVLLARQCTDMVMRNLDRADRLVKSFKQVSVDQSSEQQREIHLADYLREIVISLQPALKRAPHQVRVECAEDIVFTTYPGAIYQVITNLTMNSLTHAFDGDRIGEIRIRGARATGGHPEVEVVRIEYADNGRGMSAEVVAHVFDPFFTTRRGQGGTGLGMHIAYNLVTQMLRGTIRCESVLGEGVRFVIEIPIGGDSA